MRVYSDSPARAVSRLLLFAACCLLPAACFAAEAAIDGPDTSDAGDLVVLTARVQAKGFAWAQIPDTKKWLAVDNGRQVVFATGKAGVYTFVLATADGDKPAVYQHVVTIGKPTPPPPPPPPVPVNPHRPAAQWRQLCEPVSRLTMARLDATVLASMYAATANLLRPATAGSTSSGRGAARAAAVETTADLRAELVARGKELTLSAKYPAMAAAIEKVLAEGLTLEVRPLDKAQAGELLNTLAWAVWETGRPPPARK